MIQVYCVRWISFNKWKRGVLTSCRSGQVNARAGVNEKRVYTEVQVILTGILLKRTTKVAFMILSYEVKLAIILQ